VVPDGALSADSLATAYEWFKECAESHSECRSPRKSKFPTRIINVGVEGDEVRLLLSEGTRGDYATLSHCWGDYSPLTTTQSTISQRVKCIPFETLPKTFQHSVVVTRRLGIRYLWIDSLCIIQDSPEDWKEESAKMQDVYAGAIINISADAAANSSVGLSLGKGLGGGQQVGKADGLFCRPISTGTDSSGLSHTPRHAEFQHILSTRAWVLQERILSPRILHFSTFEMTWECHTNIRCECTVQPRKVEGARFWESLSQEVQETFDSRLWTKLVLKYSALRLTRRSDKLNAIAGLAARAAMCWSTSYIAGLWREELPICLLWRVTKKTRNARSADFPSWSWTSVDGTIQCFTQASLEATLVGSVPRLVTVTGIMYDCGTEEPYGTPLEANVYLKGQIAQVTLGTDSRSISLETDGLTEDLAQSSELYLDCVNENSAGAQQYHFLVIVAESVDRKRKLCCLILQLSETTFSNSWGAYRRVGIFLCREAYEHAYRLPKIQAKPGAGYRSLRSKFREEHVVLV